MALLVGQGSHPSASHGDFLLLPSLSLHILSFSFKLAKPDCTLCLGFVFLWKTGRRSAYDFLLAFNEVLDVLCPIFFLLILTNEACLSLPAVLDG